MLPYSQRDHWHKNACETKIMNPADAKNHVSLLATVKNPHEMWYMLLVIEIQYNKLELGRISWYEENYNKFSERHQRNGGYFLCKTVLDLLTTE